MIAKNEIITAISKIREGVVDIQYGLNKRSFLSECWGDCYMQGVVYFGDGVKISFYSNCRPRKIKKIGCIAIETNDCFLLHYPILKSNTNKLNS